MIIQAFGEESLRHPRKVQTQRDDKDESGEEKNEEHAQHFL
jgi:hypothetical protein